MRNRSLKRTYCERYDWWCTPDDRRYFYRQGRLVATPDEPGTWGGLFPGSFVLANVSPPRSLARGRNGAESLFRRFSFWGHDDTGLYREVEPEHFDSWLRWLNGLTVVVQRDLLAMGFRYD